MVYIGFVFLFILFVSFFLLHVDIYIDMIYTESKQHFQLNLSYKSIRLMKWKWINDQVANESQTDLFDFILSKSRSLVDNKERNIKIIKKYLSSFQVHDLCWESHFGLGKAPETGIALGTLWSVKGIFIPILIRQKYKPTIHLTITPYFNTIKFSTHLALSGTIPIRTILPLASKMLKVKMRRNYHG